MYLSTGFIKIKRENTRKEKYSKDGMNILKDSFATREGILKTEKHKWTYNIIILIISVISGLAKMTRNKTAAPGGFLLEMLSVLDDFGIE